MEVAVAVGAAGIAVAMVIVAIASGARALDSNLDLAAVGRPAEAVQKSVFRCHTRSPEETEEERKTHVLEPWAWQAV